jgi:hypothetical protein
MTSSFDVTSSGNKVSWNVLPLDPSIYFLLDTEREFYKARTGIQSDDELKQHILNVQSQAYSASYSCIGTIDPCDLHACRSCRIRVSVCSRF